MYGNPEVSTILRVVHALGYTLQARLLAKPVPKRKACGAPTKRRAADPVRRAE